MADRVWAIKWESPAHGGTEEDLTPAEIDVHEDFLDCRGVAIQDDTSDDEVVQLSRDADGNLTFKDAVVDTPMTLKTLSSGGTGLAFMREWIYATELAWVHPTYQFIIAEQLTLEGEFRIEGRAFIL
jgi:hypothetical protein